MNEQNRFHLLPTIETLSDAQRIGRHGTWAACIVSGMTTLFALAAISGIVPPKAILIILAFVNSVRGTFAYHRLRKT